MKPAAFDYYRPATIEDAVDALASSDSGKVLAGGQSLIPAMNFRLSSLSLLVDIRGVEGLGDIEAGDGSVTIGAAVTQSRVEQSGEAAAVVPPLRAALRQVGHLQIRNRGTVCGSLAHADPAAELPALALALGAELAVHDGSGSRTVAASEFFLGPFWVDLEQSHIVTGVTFPAPPDGTVTSVAEISRRAGDFAIVGLTSVIGAEDGSVGSATLVSFGVGGRPQRLAAAEAAATGYDGGPADAIFDAAYDDASDALDDAHATAEYRQEALASLVARGVQAAANGGRAS